jgi:glycosyltransferase involved in cell wall biosynthesis
VDVALIAEQLRRKVPGGIGTYVRGLVRGFAELDVDDVSLRPWTSRLPVPARTRLWDRGVGSVSADVVHAPSFALPGRARRLVVTVHDLAWRRVPDTFPRRGRLWHERALHRALAHAAAFVVPSSAVADDLLAAGAAANAVHVIAEGSDHLPPPTPSAIEGDFILTVGTREPRKNLAGLVAAYEKALPRLPARWPLVVVGGRGWGDGDVSHPDVVVLDGVDDAALAGLYEAARLFAYVPLFEGFGLPPLEAMRAGVPVVASTAVPSAAEAALTVAADDVAAIADALVTASLDDGVRRQLRELGAARATELTWAATAAAHVDLWRALA